MAKTLVLTGKPSVGRDIARVLGCTQKGDGCLNGDGYIVIWVLGHSGDTRRARDLNFVHDNLTHEKCPDCGKFLQM